MIIEGSITCDTATKEIVTKDMNVFYNPVMQINRDISIIFLNALGKKDMRIADPMAASGIRACRFAKELSEGIVKEIKANDCNSDAVETLKKTVDNNSCENVSVYLGDANEFLRKEGPFDYIDIDPFGTPNPFILSGISSLRIGGILAITATDTSALTGTYPKAGLRKYWSKIEKNELMHEVGVRVLIRKIQMLGAQYARALIPLYSFSTDHYYRVFFRLDSGKKKTDALMKQHNMVLFCPYCYHFEFSSHVFNSELCPFCKKKRKGIGPMWSGSLWKTELAEKIFDMSLKNDYLSKETKKLVEKISHECHMDVPFFYHVHKMWKLHGIKNQMKMDSIIALIEDKGFYAERTHFNKYAIRSDISFPEFIDLFNIGKI
jgi:tRNA (guanine26-N2/guanine27-N2)-dimethyltransferase